MAGKGVATWVKVKNSRGFTSRPISHKYEGGYRYEPGQVITISEYQKLKSKGDVKRDRVKNGESGYSSISTNPSQALQRKEPPGRIAFQRRIAETEKRIESLQREIERKEQRKDFYDPVTRKKLKINKSITQTKRYIEQEKASLAQQKDFYNKTFQ